MCIELETRRAALHETVARLDLYDLWNTLEISITDVHTFAPVMTRHRCNTIQRTMYKKSDTAFELECNLKDEIEKRTNAALANIVQNLPHEAFTALDQMMPTNTPWYSVLETRFLARYLPRLPRNISRTVADMLNSKRGARIMVRACPIFADGYHTVLKHKEVDLVVQIPICLELALARLGNLILYKGSVATIAYPATYEFSVAGTYDFGKKQPWRKCIGKPHRTAVQAQMIKQIPRGHVPCTWVVEMPINVRPEIITNNQAKTKS